jgi:ADP-heptose:LPS heptosyltransferase
VKSVIISPFSRALPSGRINPKNYPHWEELISILKSVGVRTIQVGEKGERLIGADEVKHNLSLAELKEVVLGADTWASVDNFFHHFCALHKKAGVVVFGKSDPNIFGHPININLLKDRSCLRKYQYDIWDAETFDPQVFVDPKTVFSAILTILLRK